MTIQDADWDCLVVFDACRYDVFADVYAEMGLSYPLREHDSGASNTSGWYNAHWQRPNDVVLVSANPRPWHRYTRFVAQQFKQALKAWQGNEVNPSYTLDCFEQAAESGERYLLHFIPPHLPFIGERGRALLKRAGMDEPTIYRSVYDAVQDYGRAGHWDEVQAAYRENVWMILSIVLKRLDAFDGMRVVVTADHGELTGEGNVYCHTPSLDPGGILRRVPWMVIDARH